MKPTVGMGATVTMWTDRWAGTVVKVSPSGKTIVVREDQAVRTDNNGVSETQAYSFTPSPEGQGRERTFRQIRGRWRGLGTGDGLVLGARRKYHDFSF